MKIVYLHQYFNTPEQGGSLRSYYIARAMAQAGHEVTLITTHSKKNIEVLEIEGFTIHYLPIPYQNKFGFWQRIKAFFHFAQASYKLVKTLPRPDLVYATSTPLTVGLCALWLKKRLKIPYIFEVRDLWPLVPIRLGILRNPIAQWITQRWERQIYQQASKIVALSPAMQAHIQPFVPDKEVVMVSNMADLQIHEKRIAKNKSKFIVAYFGTIGYANHLEYLVEIARQCSLSPLEFWIVGKGAKLPAVKLLTKKHQLENIVFFEHQNTHDLQKLMQEVDAVYVSFLANPILNTTSPNKFFEALAAGKLCIVNTTGWLQILVEDNACGFYAHPEKPQEFLEKIRPFLENVDLLAQYQQNARTLAEKEFSVEILTKRIVEFL